ncbi:unnamed protein product [Schistosoma rodhaini]|uniref:MMS22L_C domain-containing protein n=1 Tax=Schistosoma mansoni TaxID=6183 RepID=A0A5K4EX51_SCHMA|nr:unnamed protein product [Schistosoma rodhaini]
MSDPAFWTPPDSPEFRGIGAIFSEDLDADLLTEIDFDVQQPTPFLGLCCDTVDPIKFLSRFETTTTVHWADPQEILCLLRNKLVLLKKSSFEFQSDSADLRNDVSFLLLALCSSVTETEFEKRSVVPLVGCIRSVLGFLGPLTSLLEAKTNKNFIHAHLEIWLTVLKIFNFLCNRAEYVELVNETLGLKPQSSLNACGYFLDIVLENLILYSGLTNFQRCSCDTILWVVIMHFVEKTQKNWFKFFHGKMIKLSAQQRAEFSEFNTLECVRPNFKSYFQSSSLDISHQSSLTVWSLYWNVLAYTTPIYSLYADHTNQSKVGLGTLQKYSIVVWLIRQQFLGETTPNNSEVHFCLTSLLRLSETCGINLEVVRSLWLYFKSWLSTGFDTSNRSSGLFTPSMSFRCWYSKVKPECEVRQNFVMFCSLLRRLSPSDIEALCTTLKIPLLSLTKQSISHYFFIWANLVEEALDTLSVSIDNMDNNKICLLSLVDNIVEISSSLLESNNVAQKSLHNWDPNRGCILLQCLQYLLVMFEEYGCLHSELHIYLLRLLPVVEKINGVIFSLRRSLSLSNELLSTESEFALTRRPVAFNRLSTSNRISDFTSISIQFLVDLLVPNNSTHVSLPSGRTFLIIQCLGSSYFDSISWPFDIKWNECVLQLLEAVCSLAYSESNLEVFSFFWSSVYPAFKKAISRQSAKFAPIPVNLLSILSKIALYFLRLSNICFSYRSEHKLTLCLLDPADLFDLFTMNPSIDFSFHFSIMKAFYGTSSAIKELVTILNSSKKETSTVAWLFFVALLTYCLFVRTVNSFSTESHDDFVFPSFISEIRAYLPKQITISTISNLDPETIFINIAAYFDELSTFQARMSFKSVFVEYIGRLSEFICTCCSVSSVAQESGFGLSHMTQSSFLKPEDLCGSGYQVAGMLVRHCSMLLYSPVTTEGSVSSFENLVNHFFLPRQLYETQDSNKFSTLNESDIFPCFVMESMQEQLPEFTRGIAQLNWRSDPYICRIIKDIVKIHYKHFGPGAIASMVLHSPTLDFRTHILQFATYDQITYLTESKVLPVSGCEQITYQHNILSNWVNFAYAIFSNTHSSGIYLSDAPFLVCPILLSNTLKDLTSALNSDSRKHSIHILKMYKEAVASVTCKETRSRILELCCNLDKKTMDPSCNLVAYFGLK